jgi:hypothetical protein
MNTSLACRPFDRPLECEGRHEAAITLVNLFKGPGQ